jgi:hypothetical protein
MMGRLTGFVAAAVLSAVCWSGIAQAVTYTQPDDSLACAFYTKREARKDFGERRGHVAFCANSKGWITGAVLSPSGKVRCEIEGFMNPNSGCGSVLWCDDYLDLPCD